MSLSVEVQNYAGKKSHIPSKKKFQHWTKRTAQLTPRQRVKLKSLCIRIVDDDESAALNKKFRRKKGPTNVLSFAYLGDDSRSLSGDLAICAELVKAEALSQQKKIEAHWAHLTVHGMLHVLGYDHVQTQAAKKMEALEIKILKNLGYPNPYLSDK